MSLGPFLFLQPWALLGLLALPLLWLLLRGAPQRFKRIGWTYEILSLLESGSALVFVPVDELRVLWLYTNIPCVFILLGQRAGWGVTGLTMVGFLMGNEYLEKPYSPSAMATGVLAMVYLGVSFHAYVDRSISYFKRMRDYNMQLHDLASHDPLTGTLSLSRTNAFFLGGGKALLNAVYATAEKLGVAILYDTEVREVVLGDPTRVPVPDTTRNCTFAPERGVPSGARAVIDTHLAGGLGAWKSAGLPTVRGNH